MIGRGLRSWRGRLVLGVLAYACGACSSQVVCHPDGITGTERCTQAGGYGDAAITGGAAAGLFAAKGCTLNGCEPPSTCNSQSKLCERMKCSEVSACPPGYECSMSDHRCW
jgi:hypothetical protein